MERTVELDTHLSDWVDLLGVFWCRHFHDSVMWPIHGEYECRSCGRRHSVPWDPRNNVPDAAFPGIGCIERQDSWPAAVASSIAGPCCST